ncbi:hypothetical protein CEXT_112841 [Caerostris extrusa]|uniref:Uncharacterized protein n=1 Tax=Caerostris extrusa TaxID=172846 RepID=A0AAV4Q921_CAEEX|nr:hypothetical protein CEXT_112841 [Caerostris extrusa]
MAIEYSLPLKALIMVADSNLGPTVRYHWGTSQINTRYLQSIRHFISPFNAISIEESFIWKMTLPAVSTRRGVNDCWFNCVISFVWNWLRAPSFVTLRQLSSLLRHSWDEKQMDCSLADDVCHVNIECAILCSLINECICEHVVHS